MKLTKFILLKALVIGQIGLLQAADSEIAKPKLSEDASKALTSFSKDIAADAMLAVLTLDKNGNGGVPLTNLTKHLMSRGFAQVSSSFEEKGKVEKRQEEGAVRMDHLFLKMLETDVKGDLREEGFAKGIETAMMLRLSRMIPLDANKDGKLTLKEYAVGSPIRENEERDLEGFTKNQRERFANFDKDKNQFIEGVEYISSFDWVRHAVKGSMAAIYIDRADKDSDGTLSGEELRTLLPQAENLPKSVTIKESIHWLRKLKPKEIEEIKNKLLTTK